MRVVGGEETCSSALTAPSLAALSHTAPSLIATAIEVAHWLLRHENTSHENRYEKHQGMAKLLE